MPVLYHGTSRAFATAMAGAANAGTIDITRGGGEFGRGFYTQDEMAFVHGLVRAENGGRKGWIAPLEMGEAAPHYVSFVIPLDKTRGFFNAYTCESITTINGDKRNEVHELLKKGADTFLLQLGGFEIWFVVRPEPKDQQRLPYVGSLGHDDFRYSLVEIEPERPEILDKLFNEKRTFVVGCEPFTHYSGIQTLEKTG